MRSAEHTVAATWIAAAALLLGPAHAMADDEDSSWPESSSRSVQLRAVRAVVRKLEDKVRLMELSAARYADWDACLRGVPISEYGDPDRRYGYRYDERDGTGLGFMPALAIDRTSRPGREDYLFLDFGRGHGCGSNAPSPGGTAEPASVTPRALVSAHRSRGGGLRALERRVRRLKRAKRRLSAAAERFDAWESCVSQVPVTEYGDADGGFGYAFGQSGAAFEYRAALAIDRSDWDDPDYMFLAFVGGDRPGGRCQDEPGEAVD